MFFININDCCLNSLFIQIIKVTLNHSSTSSREAGQPGKKENITLQIFHPRLNKVKQPISRVAEVVREHGWHPPKSLDSDENFKPEHTLFCRELRFVAIYTLFGDLWAKKVPFWVKNSVSWARSALLHGIYCIFH